MEASEDRKDESHILGQAEADSSDSLLRFLLPVLVILVGALLF